MTHGEIEVDRVLFTDVSFSPGWGDSGRRIEVVKCECEYCGFDRMFRTVRVNPEFSDEFEYDCMLPNCPDYNRPPGLLSF